MARTEPSSLQFQGLATQALGVVQRQPTWLIVPVGFLGLIIVLVAGRSPEYETLLSGLRFRADELAAIEATFARASLGDYEIRDEGIWVPKREKALYIRALEDADVLPRALNAPLQEALAASHFFESPAQRQARWKLAGEQELASYLRALDGIEDATVRFDEVRQDGLQRKESVRAMVVLKPSRGTVLVPERLQTISELVAASRIGLSASDVTIFDLRSGQTFTTGAEWTPAQRREQWTHRKLTYEAHWNKKIADLLTFIPRVSVATDVQLLAESLAPDRIHVVVMVPHPYYQAVWYDRLRREGAPKRGPTVSELQVVHREVDANLEETIGQLFPSDASASPTVTVAIASVPDVPSATISEAPTWNAQPSVVVCVVLLLVVGCTMALAGFLRDLVGNLAHGSVTNTDRRDRNEESGPSVAASVVPSVTTRIDHGASERDELARLVRTNPAAAAATLRSWVDPTS